jgi:hypothetical protein
MATLPVWAQERCGIVQVQKEQQRPAEADDQFEYWIEKNKKARASGVKGAKQTESTYKIPVVVHIIHNGSNHATNISDEQVISQINVLNKDFNRLNTDASSTPSAFVPIAGAVDIEFVLARRTPEGLPTTGIVRVQGAKTSWSTSDNYQLKATSYWPAEDYLNIWVCNLTGYLGYAQFPQSTMLNGLETASSNRLTDGVVIAYDAFGSIDDGNFNLDPKFNKGRTTTHEVGHFFGLRHIAGDDRGQCGGTGDYVADTPDQASQNYNCPSHPLASCNTTSMFQNYLDYTNDACMNLFTQGQVDRMIVVIENSPRRKSLLTSNALNDPEPMANDIGILAISSPAQGECPGIVIPSVQLKNYGSNTISTAEIRFLVDNVTIETVEFTGSLDELESAFIEFSPVTLEPGTYAYTFQVLTTNGGADGNALNNIMNQAVFVPVEIPTPVIEQFSSLPSEWPVFNPDNLFTWKVADVPLGSTPNTAITMEFYNYEDNEGEIDVITTPVLNLEDVPEALLLFNVAHARYQTSSDGLRVVVLSECNSDVNQGTVLYEKFGSELATHAATNSFFKPLNSAAWRTETLDLQPYIGQRIRLAFVGINDWGNNVYLDNIRVITDAAANLALTDVIAPSPANCRADIEPRIMVKNVGTMINSFTIEYVVNGQQSSHIVNTPMAPGLELEVPLPTVTLAEGNNTLSFSITDIDGQADIDPSDNTLVTRTAMNTSMNAVPFRETFQADAPGDWTSINPTNGPSWAAKPIDANISMFHNGFTNTNIGEEVWLISPYFDLTNIDEASLYFEYSHRSRNNVSDQLEVRASLGCDQPFDQSLRIYSGTALTDLSSTTAWTPATAADWSSKNIDMASLLGTSEVRIAFVLTNNNSNNFYLDNIELFLSKDPEKVEIEGLFSVYPNPSTATMPARIAFNLPELADASIEVIDNVGRILSRHEVQNALNQVLSLDTEDLSYGLYFVRVSIEGKTHIARFVITR